MMASHRTNIVIPGEREAFSAPALAGEVPTEALAEVGEGGMHRSRPLRFARKGSLSTSPAARARGKARSRRRLSGSAGNAEECIFQLNPIKLCVPP